MNAREIIKTRMAHQGTPITPYTLSFESGLYARLTEHYQDEAWEKKKLRRFMATYLGVDTVGMRPLDDIYSKDAYGALWRMNRKPWHLDRPPLSEPTLEGYTFPTAEEFVAPILRDKPGAIQKYEQDHEHFRVISMGWGIFEHAWRLRGFENALTDTVTDEDFYREMTTKITDLYIAMLKACEDVPADAYHFGDDWGDQRGVIIGAKTWRKLIKPCWARIYEEVHRQGKVSLQHSCGSIASIYDDLIEIGMDCHESVQPEAGGMAPDEVKKNWGDRLTLWGCLGSQSTLFRGTPKEIRQEIFRLRDLFLQDGGFILAPAKPLADEMPLDKAVAVVEAFAQVNG